MGSDAITIEKYRRRISGPILDRIDIQKYVKPVDFFELTNQKSGRTSKELREKVEFADRKSVV